METEIKDPLMELTEWVYEFDRNFHLYEKGEGICFATKEELLNHSKRILVDTEGNVVTILHHEVLKRNWRKLFYLPLPTK